MSRSKTNEILTVYLRRRVYLLETQINNFGSQEVLISIFTIRIEDNLASMGKRHFANCRFD